MLVLYSTGCPKCGILKKKLDERGMQYQENTAVEEMLSLGITSVPVPVSYTHLDVYKRQIKKVMDTPTLVRMKSLQRFPGSWINTIYL